MFEEIDNEKRHSKALTVIATFVLVATMIGVAIAAWTWTFTGSKTSTVSTGNISMSLLESTDTVNLTNALPVSDSTGMSYTADGQKFDFAVTTYASGAPGTITYSISITKVAVDDTYTALADNEIKVYLAALDDSNVETQVMAPTLVSNIITSGSTGTLTFDSGKTSYLSHAHTSAGTTKTQKYRLKMWVASTTDASSWNSTTKLQYKLKVNASGSLS